jgi:biotin carboxyl carrier protein
MGAAGPVGIASMNVDVMVNGRPWKVAVESAEPAGTFTVTIKGKSRRVDASWIDEHTVSLIDGGAAREIRLHQREDPRTVGVEIHGRLYEAVVSRATGTTGAIGATGAAGAIGATGVTGAMGASSIKAPMPGRVVRVLVAVGDDVHARQAVVVVEAMKMENELRSPRDGVVKEITVSPGAAVESGAVLVVVGD